MRVAVLGAGQMGGGIAHVCALAGRRVDLHDSSAAQLDGALGAVGRNLGRQVSKGSVTRERADAALGAIAPRPALGDWLGDADFVVEAIVEDAAAKRALYAEVAPRMGADAVLATNTSSCSVTALGRGCGREPRFIGMHFMNPAPLMPLVEVVRGADTSDRTVERTERLARDLGKETVRSEDYPGFVTNRILMPLINEAAFALHEGVGTVDAIDRAARLGLGHPMGPLALADLIGLDTCLAIMRVLLDGFGDPKFRPCPLLVRLVDAGRLGRKSGTGFYDHRSDPPVPAA